MCIWHDSLLVSSENLYKTNGSLCAIHTHTHTFSSVCTCSTFRIFRARKKRDGEREREKVIVYMYFTLCELYISCMLNSNSGENDDDTQQCKHNVLSEMKSKVKSLCTQVSARVRWRGIEGDRNGEKTAQSVAGGSFVRSFIGRRYSFCCYFSFILYVSVSMLHCLSGGFPLLLHFHFSFHLVLCVRARSFFLFVCSAHIHFSDTMQVFFRLFPFLLLLLHVRPPFFLVSSNAVCNIVSKFIWTERYYISPDGIVWVYFFVRSFCLSIRTTES